MKLHILGLLACVVVVGIAVCVLAQSTEPPVVAPVGPTPVLPGQVVPGGPGGIPRVPGGPGVIGTGRDGVDYEALGAQADAMKSFTGSLFDARSAAVTAVYALKDDLKPEEAIKLFTARLEKTKVQGLRNAIHMARQGPLQGPGAGRQGQRPAQGDPRRERRPARKDQSDK